MKLLRFIPILDPSVRSWAIDARLLRWLTFLWLFLGLAVLFSASYYTDMIGVESGNGFYFQRQLLWAGIGLAGFQALVHTPLRRLLKISTPLFLILLALVFATRIPGLGVSINGAARWIALGPVLIQPSELIKPLLVVQSAYFFSRWPRLPWKRRAIWLAIFGAVLLGILIQPNLSTTALCGITLWLVALAAGLPYVYLGGAALVGLLLALLSVSIKEYQRRRVMSFLNPWADPMGDGYQLIQSLLATGSGGVWGSGFGLSQQKLGYLPFQNTDFIFAVFAEEFGLIGSFLLLLLLTVYGVIALRVALRTQVPEYRLIAIGAMVLMLGQSLLHIGVATGALPTTGLPLPLFSAGGSSMLASLLTAGLLVRVAREGYEADVIALTQPLTPGKMASPKPAVADPNLSAKRPGGVNLKGGKSRRSVLQRRKKPAGKERSGRSRPSGPPKKRFPQAPRKL